MINDAVIPGHVVVNTTDGTIYSGWHPGELFSSETDASEFAARKNKETPLYTHSADGSLRVEYAFLVCALLPYGLTRAAQALTQDRGSGDSKEEADG